MKYLNLPTSAAQDELVMRATHEQIGIWFLLLAYCHAQMNGGYIRACTQWPDEMWHRIAGTTSAVMAQDSPLWTWNSTTLAIHLYDQPSEDAYKKKQRMGRIYIERRWAAEREKKIIRLSSGSSKAQKANDA